MGQPLRDRAGSCHARCWPPTQAKVLARRPGTPRRPVLVLSPSASLASSRRPSWTRRDTRRPFSLGRLSPETWSLGACRLSGPPCGCFALRQQSSGLAGRALGSGPRWADVSPFDPPVRSPVPPFPLVSTTASLFSFAFRDPLVAVVAVGRGACIPAWPTPYNQRGESAREKNRDSSFAGSHESNDGARLFLPLAILDEAAHPLIRSFARLDRLVAGLIKT